MSKNCFGWTERDYFRMTAIRRIRIIFIWTRLLSSVAEPDPVGSEPFGLIRSWIKMPSNQNFYQNFLTFFWIAFFGQQNFFSKIFATFFEEYIYKNNKGVFNFWKSQFLKNVKKSIFRKPQKKIQKHIVNFTFLSFFNVFYPK